MSVLSSSSSMLEVPMIDLDFTWDMDSLLTHDLVPSLTISKDMAFLTPAKLALLLGTIILCQTIYTVLHRGFGVSPKNSVRIVALFHAIHATVFPLWMHFSGNHDMIQPIKDDYCAVIPMIPYLAGVSASFFIWDLYVCIKQGWGFAFVFHGFACAYLFLHPALGPILHHDAIVFDFYEASTIFLNSYQLAFAFGYPRLASLLRYVFAAVFISVRLGFGLYSSYHFQRVFIWGNPNQVNLECYPTEALLGPPLLSCLMYPLNLYWSVGIFRALCQRAKGKQVGYNEVDQKDRQSSEQSKKEK